MRSVLLNCALLDIKIIKLDALNQQQLFKNYVIIALLLIFCILGTILSAVLRLFHLIFTNTPQDNAIIIG